MRKRDPSPAPADSEPDPDWRTFTLVAVALAVTQLSYNLTAAALSLYLRDLGAAPGRIGFEVGLGNIAGLALAFLVGPALNRYGSDRFLRLGGLLYLVAAVGMLLLRQEFLVALFRTLQGVGTAILLPSAYTLGARLIPRRRGAALGIMGSISNLSLAIGPPIGLVLYGAHGAAWLLVPAILASGVGLLAASLVPRAKTTHQPARGFGFDRVWVPGLMANMLSSAYFGGSIAYLPLYLRHLHGPNAGIFFTADAVGVLLLRVPTGMLVDRSGSLVPKLIGLVITLAGIGVLVFPPSIPVLIAAGACTGVGAGLLITGVMTDLSNLSREANRGTAMSTGGASLSAAFFLGGTVSGLLIGPGGFNAVLAVGAVSCILAVPFVLAERATVARVKHAV